MIIWVYVIKSCISGFSCQRIKHVVWHTCRLTCLTFTSNQWIIQWITPSLHLERWKTSYRSTNKTNWLFHSILICSRVPSIEMLFVFLITICILYIYVVWWNSHVLGTVDGWNLVMSFLKRSFFFCLDNHEAVSVFGLFLLRTRFLGHQFVLLGPVWSVDKCGPLKMWYPY